MNNKEFNRKQDSPWHTLQLSSVEAQSWHIANLNNCEEEMVKPHIQVNIPSVECFMGQLIVQDDY